MLYQSDECKYEESFGCAARFGILILWKWECRGAEKVKVGSSVALGGAFDGSLALALVGKLPLQCPSVACADDNLHGSTRRSTYYHRNVAGIKLLICTFEADKDRIYANCQMIAKARVSICYKEDRMFARRTVTTHTVKTTTATLLGTTCSKFWPRKSKAVLLLHQQPCARFRELVFRCSRARIPGNIMGSLPVMWLPAVLLAGKRGSAA